MDFPSTALILRMAREAIPSHDSASPAHGRGSPVFARAPRGLFCLKTE